MVEWYCVISQLRTRAYNYHSADSMTYKYSIIKNRRHYPYPVLWWNNQYKLVLCKQLAIFFIWNRCEGHNFQHVTWYGHGSVTQQCSYWNLDTSSSGFLDEFSTLNSLICCFSLLAVQFWSSCFKLFCSKRKLLRASAVWLKLIT